MLMANDEIVLVIKKVLQGEPDFDLNGDYIENGLLDSLAFIDLIAEFENYGIEIQPTEITYENFRNLNEIIKTVSRFATQI
jgi:D-alanine--poly(phosphoribitol) ligase subunit 2